MHETSKSIQRRVSDIRYATRFFVGHGLDVGAGNDSLMQYQHLFPLMRSCRDWDVYDGDAQFLATLEDGSFDFLHSSHCLEHMVNPMLALGHWIRVVRSGGHIIITVPEEDLYEQGVFPSTFNGDHKWTFTIFKHSSWSDKSVNVVDMVRHYADYVEPIVIQKVDSFYRYGLDRMDQTLHPATEAAIEIVFKVR